MNCGKCGKEMRIGTEQVGIQNGVAVYNQFAYCDECGEKVNVDALKKSQKNESRYTVLSVLACAFSLFSCLDPVAFILAVVDLCLYKKGKNHAGSIFAIVMSILYTFALIYLFRDFI